LRTLCGTFFEIIGSISLLEDKDDFALIGSGSIFLFEEVLIGLGSESIFFFELVLVGSESIFFFSKKF